LEAAIKIQFGLGDFVVFSTILAGKKLISDCVRSSGNFVRNLISLGLTISIINLIPLETFGLCLLFCKGEVFLGDSLIVTNRGYGGREKFATLSGGFHVSDDAVAKHHVLFRRVLFVENAVGFVLESDAAKKIIGTLQT